MLDREGGVSDSINFSAASLNALAKDMQARTGAHKPEPKRRPSKPCHYCHGKGHTWSSQFGRQGCVVCRGSGRLVDTEAEAA